MCHPRSRRTHCGASTLKDVVITVLGRDRPGILAAVSAALLAHGGNISNVSQTLLGRVFGALLQVEIPPALDPGELERRLRADLAALALDVFVRRYPAGSLGPAPPAEPFIVTTFGPDRPGLVAAVTAVLARHAANVTNTKAVFRGGSVAEHNVMIFEVDVPETADLGVLRRDLEAVAARLELDLNIHHRRLFEMMNRI